MSKSKSKTFKLLPKVTMGMVGGLIPCLLVLLICLVLSVRALGRIKRS